MKCTFYSSRASVATTLTTAMLSVSDLDKTNKQQFTSTLNLNLPIYSHVNRSRKPQKSISAINNIPADLNKLQQARTARLAVFEDVFQHVPLLIMVS